MLSDPSGSPFSLHCTPQAPFFPDRGCSLLSLGFCLSQFHKRQPGVSQGRRFCPACSSLNLSASLICIHSLWIGVSNNIEGNPWTHLGQRSWPAAGSVVFASERRF
ncbi:hypothetical protein ANANG_G00104100 [Anguilla anguilla]|uniref:Uncharacterized protein n=1 Tax=Anguilla anguilla TaxID=7936 RepID=A0A9D3S3I0_ANGAN|nr:hypothetical protein ANANG_G00104100 [Anguilla anguilla]